MFFHFFYNDFNLIVKRLDQIKPTLLKNGQSYTIFAKLINFAFYLFVFQNESV